MCCEERRAFSSAVSVGLQAVIDQKTSLFFKSEVNMQISRRLKIKDLFNFRALMNTPPRSKPVDVAMPDASPTSASKRVVSM